MTSLPFLYPRMARPLRGAVVRQFLRAYSEASSSTTTTTSPSTNSTTSSTSSPSRSRLRVRHDPIPFELPPGMQDEVETDERVEGTITPMERQAFTKIFSEIARSATTTPSAPKRDASDIIEDASTELFRAREQVRSERREALEASISVLSRLDKLDDMELDMDNIDSLDNLDNPQSESARRRVLAEFPPSLRTAASEAIGSRERQSQQLQQQQQKEEETDPVLIAAAKKAADTAELRQKRQETMERIMMSKATDAALWEYMEECVFSMVDEFGLQASPNDAKVAGKKGKGKDKGKKGKTAKTKLDRPPSNALLKYAPVYPAVLLHGLRLLGSHYGGGEPSPLALQVLPRIKSLGLPSYVLGASTPLYNELLRLQWTRLGDAVAVFALLQEMQQAGLAFNDGTLAVLKSMEFHLCSPSRSRQTSIDMDSMHRPMTGRGTSFVGAAMAHLPDVAALPDMVEWWRKQVEAGAMHSRRFE